MQRALSLALALVLTVLPAVEAAAHGSHGHFHRPPPLAPSAMPGAVEAARPGLPEQAAEPLPPDAAAAAGQPLDPAAALAAGAESASGAVAAAPAERDHDHQHAHAVPDVAPAADAAALFDGQAPRRGLLDAVWSTLRYPAVVRGVDELLDGEKPAARRAAAARALGRLKRPETARALAAASRDRDPAVAEAAREALLAVAPAAARTSLRAYRPPEDEFESARRPVHYEALKRVVAVSAVFTAIEAIGSYLTGSVSLQADAMHLTADLMINVGTLYAAYVARRPPDPRNTYGSLKIEPLIGLISAAAIAALGAFAGYEALGRLLHPASVPAVQTMLLALSGLTSNVLSTVLLYRFRGDSLSLRGAFLHAATDALGSVGIILAGALILCFGWLWADPLITFAIVALIARTTWDLGRGSWSVLMDAVPEDIELGELERELLLIPGAAKVADLHVWSVSSMERAATLKLRVAAGTPHEAALAGAKAVFARWHVRHSTVEITAG